MDATKFLSTNPPITERLYCIRNNITEQPVCKKCNTPIKFARHLSRYGSYCSRICSETSSERYNKIQQTCLDRYGYITLAKNSDIQTKIKQTNKEKYGVEFPLQSKQIHDRTVQTGFERYGCHPLQFSEFKKQAEISNLEKYGVTNVFKSAIIREKIKQTLLETYGVENYRQYHLLGVNHLINDYDWLYEQYVNQNKTIQQIADSINISNYSISNKLRQHNIEIRLTYNYSYKCIQWLNSISEKYGINIQHALNGGEYQIPGTRYKVDGYCKETNTIYEFYGDYWHGNPEVYESDIIHEYIGVTMGELYNNTKVREDILKNLGYNIIVMWEKDLNPIIVEK